MKCKSLAKPQNQEVESCKSYVARKSSALFLVMVVMVSSLIAASASEVNTVTSADFQPVMDAISAQISVSTIVGVLSVAVAACVGMVFMWWGIRKAARMLMAAFKKGKVSL